MTAFKLCYSELFISAIFQLIAFFIPAHYVSEHRRPSSVNISSVCILNTFVREEQQHSASGRLISKRENGSKATIGKEHIWTLQHCLFRHCNIFSFAGCHKTSLHTSCRETDTAVSCFRPAVCGTRRHVLHAWRAGLAWAQPRVNNESCKLFNISSSSQFTLDRRGRMALAFLTCVRRPWWDSWVTLNKSVC